MKKQVVSKKRVADHGELFTGRREVNVMLDLVKQETERIESRFLEPACGKGNFLAEIPERKLLVVKTRYGKSQLEYERSTVLAVSCIYGIDILYAKYGLNESEIAFIESMVRPMELDNGAGQWVIN